MQGWIMKHKFTREKQEFVTVPARSRHRYVPLSEDGVETLNSMRAFFRSLSADQLKAEFPDVGAGAKFSFDTRQWPSVIVEIINAGHRIFSYKNKEGEFFSLCKTDILLHGDVGGTA